MVSRSEIYVLQKRNYKNNNKMTELDVNGIVTTGGGGGIVDNDDNEVILRYKNVTFDQELNHLCNNNIDGQQINNINQITTILNSTNSTTNNSIINNNNNQNGNKILDGVDGVDDTFSYKSNDLWRLDNFTIINQRHSFIHRNINVNNNNNNNNNNNVVILRAPPQRSKSFQQQTSTSSSNIIINNNSNNSNLIPFRRESIIRQSWNNLWRKNKEKLQLIKDDLIINDNHLNDDDDDDENLLINEINSDNLLNTNIIIKDTNNNSNNSLINNINCGKITINNNNNNNGSDINLLEKVVIKAKDSFNTITSRHSRNNSSSSSSSSYRSTSSIGLGIRSAPSTPMSPLQGQSEQHLSTTQGQSAVSLNAISRSPSHSSTKSDSKSIKQLSSSTPPSGSSSSSTTTVNNNNTNNKNNLNPGKSKNDLTSLSSHQLQQSSSSGGTTTGLSNDKDKEPKEKKRKELSSSRQKKFHRHFQQVALDEKVINYFSCALVSDILLQGHLYITDNYFAFYSNVFGYVTKLLIPTVSVVKISKEKTGKIFPNAVGVATVDERHVFGSFMSREAAYRLMISVWRPIEEEPEISAIVKLPDFEVSSIEDDSSCSVSGNESPPRILDTLTTDVSTVIRTKQPLDGVAKLVEIAPVILKEEVIKHIIAAPLPLKTAAPSPKKFEIKFPTDIHIVYLGFLLAVILTIFSVFLLYRIQDIQARTSGFSSIDFKLGTGNDIDVYAEVLRWQKEMQAKSAEEAQIILNSNLEQIARVRKSLETLSILIHDKNSPFVQSGNSPIEYPET